MTEQGSYPPIGSYALISDCHSAALVSRDGSVDWCAYHRFDARPVFARLLDWSKGGYFRIGPTGPSEVTRRYLPHTNVLETRFQGKGGSVVLTDSMLMLRTEAGRLGTVHPHPQHELLRLVRCEEGEVEVGVEFVPRFDYGLTVPHMEPRGEDMYVIYGGADALVMQADLDLHQTGPCSAAGEVTMRAGDQAHLVLSYSLPHELAPERIDPDELDRRFEHTVSCWRDWSDRSEYEGPYEEQVERSALVLKALTNVPTGAVSAAPTTSLPEEIGGVRNWDYRYTWVRDASFSIYALFSLGYTEEAGDFMAWLERTATGAADDLQIMYGVAGERLLHEVELSHLEGYRGSHPVRIGNGAATQFQLDIYGDVLDTAWQYHLHGGTIGPGYRNLSIDSVDFLAENWMRPDAGIWESRGEPQHFVYSKVMAWVAVDRGIKLATKLGWEVDVERWRRLRDEVRASIERDGVDAETGAFTQHYGAQELDAANLLIPLVRFLPPEDPRIRATMNRTIEELSTDGLVHRYRGLDDGLPGDEGAFVICSFWLVDNLAMAGELERARELFERLCAFTNEVGLLGEEVEPATGEQLGNFPQAFSHMGLINSAVNIGRAERRLEKRRD